MTNKATKYTPDQQDIHWLQTNFGGKFQWTDEATKHIRYTFKSIQCGFGYHGRIVVKKSLLGYDKDNQLITTYSNKGWELYSKNISGIVTISAIRPNVIAVV